MNELEQLKFKKHTLESIFVDGLNFVYDEESQTMRLKYLEEISKLNKKIETLEKQEEK